MSNITFVKHNNVADNENVYAVFFTSSPSFPFLFHYRRSLLFITRTTFPGGYQKAIEKDVFSSSSTLLRFLALFPAQNSRVKRRNRFCTR